MNSDRLKVRCVVAGIDQNDNPDFYFCVVECTQAQYDVDDHTAAALDHAESEGFDGRVVYNHLDNRLPWLFKRFMWETATVVPVDEDA